MIERQAPMARNVAAPFPERHPNDRRPRFFLDPGLYRRLPARGRAELVALLNLLVAQADDLGRVLGGQALRAELLGKSQRQVRRLEDRLERGRAIVVREHLSGNRREISVQEPSAWLPARSWDEDEVIHSPCGQVVDNPECADIRDMRVRTPMSALSASAIGNARASSRLTEKNDSLNVSGSCPRPQDRCHDGSELLARVQARLGPALRTSPRLRSGLFELVAVRGFPEASDEVERILDAARRAHSPAAYVFSCLALPAMPAPIVSPKGGARGPAALGSLLEQGLLFGAQEGVIVRPRRRP